MFIIMLNMINGKVLGLNLLAGWGLFVPSLHGVPVSVWLSSLQPKNMLFRSVGQQIL